MPRVEPRDGVWQDSAHERTSGIEDEEGEPTGKTVDREIASRVGIRHRTLHAWIMQAERADASSRAKVSFRNHQVCAVFAHVLDRPESVFAVQSSAIDEIR